MRIKARLGNRALSPPADKPTNPVVTIIEIGQERYESDGRTYYYDVARYFDEHGHLGSVDPRWLTVIE